MVRCSSPEPWLGDEIGLQKRTLKFQSPGDELGYVTYCLPRLNRTSCLFTCVGLIFITVRLLYGVYTQVSVRELPATQAVRGPIAFAALGSIFAAMLCYLVVQMVPQWSQQMRSVFKEAYLVGVCSVGLVFAISTSEFYMSQLLRQTLPDGGERREIDNAYQMEVTLLVLAGTHLMVPVRWCMLAPLEFLSIIWHPCWVVATSSWGGLHSRTFFQHAMQCFIVAVFVMGKRNTECTERYLFKKYLSEKCRRVDMEFQLSSHMTTKTRAGTSEVSSRAAFNSIGMTGDLRREIDAVMALGRKERWVIDRGIVVTWDTVLGEGGFGKVCMAHLHGTPVVVKIPTIPLSGWVGSEASHLRMLGNEIRTLRRIRHPNIVLFHGAVFFEEDAVFGIVLEHVDGLMLSSCVDQLQPPWCLSLCLDVSRALHYLHSQEPPIIHGDLKPNNLMVMQVFGRPVAKLIDFGLARLITHDAPRAGGTRAWTAPEQVVDPYRTPSERLDIFAFGCIAFYMEHLTSPMHAIHTGSTLQLDESTVLEWPDSGRSYLTDGTRDLVRSCLAVSPVLRPDSMRELQGLLQDAVRDVDRMPAEADPALLKRYSIHEAAENFMRDARLAQQAGGATGVPSGQGMSALVTRGSTVSTSSFELDI